MHAFSFRSHPYACLLTQRSYTHHTRLREFVDLFLRCFFLSPFPRLYSTQVFFFTSGAGGIITLGMEGIMMIWEGIQDSKWQRICAHTEHTRPMDIWQHTHKEMHFQPPRPLTTRSQASAVPSNT
ncbi:hypothetical protein M406DRAFT_102724 [Cryphonectria parasitica EP155]|uniref:Uncharacterized protein n=1 Tax=Cryphonectria parasitica (strain ATCC 38755 / EP155) TaxID=660469 RepID=A0A9P4Y8P7_CRYP1|nr:uncharacterized protein M406DRAFT_102724 [Cryphonectria parasitica EP155]KAF3768464.1 hypothetical protein M406DRAFT_102724 [Cryphonectria parasitica EP155]